MSLNYVLIVAAVIFLMAVIVGGIRGLIKTFFAAFSVAIALFIAVQAGPYLGKILQDVYKRQELFSIRHP